LNYRTCENDEGEKKYLFEIISNDLLLLNKKEYKSIDNFKEPKRALLFI